MSTQPARLTIFGACRLPDEVKADLHRDCDIVFADEIALFPLLGAARRATESIDLIRSRAWSGWTATQLNGVELFRKQLGILGMGRIGRALAARARAFEMTIHYSNRRRLAPDLEQGA